MPVLQHLPRSGSGEVSAARRRNESGAGAAMPVLQHLPGSSSSVGNQFPFPILPYSCTTNPDGGCKLLTATKHGRLKRNRRGAACVRQDDPGGLQRPCYGVGSGAHAVQRRHLGGLNRWAGQNIFLLVFGAASPWPCEKIKPAYRTLMEMEECVRRTAALLI